MQKSLIALSQSTHKGRSTSMCQYSIALLDARVGCHPSVRGDNILYLELVNALIEQINVTSKLDESMTIYIYESMTICQSY